DWLRQRPLVPASSGPAPSSGSTPLPAAAATPRVEDAHAVPKKLSYMERRELEALPARIEALEQERSALGAAVSHPDFYKETAAAIAAALDRERAIEQELAGLYARWDDLDSRAR